MPSATETISPDIKSTKVISRDEKNTVLLKSNQIRRKVVNNFL